MCDTPPDRLLASAPFAGELLIWLSPSFPVGSFAYSQGLELAVDRNWITDYTTLREWTAAVVGCGSLKNDLIIISLVMRAEARSDIDALVELSNALQPSCERAQEALDQGRSFVAAYRAGWAERQGDEDVFGGIKHLTYPAALAMAARAHNFDPAATLEAYGIAFCNNLLSAAIRLAVIGQFDGQRLMANLLPILRDAAATARCAAIDHLGSATYGADLASMLHETQSTRLFRS